MVKDKGHSLKAGPREPERRGPESSYISGTAV